MIWYVVVFWIVLLALPWVAWYRRGPEQWPDSRRATWKSRAPTLKSAVRQHSDTGMRLLHEKKWAEAVDAFEDALDMLRDDPSEEVLLRFYRGYALEQMGQLEEAIAGYEDCQAIYGCLHQEMQYVAAVRHGGVLAKLGRFEQAEQHLQRTLAALQRGPQSVSWVQFEALHILVGMSRATNNHARAVEYSQQGVRTAHRLRDAAAQAGFLRAAGQDQRVLGSSEEALHSYEQSLDLYRRTGETGSAATVQQDIALVYQLEGQWDKALAWLQACLADEERDQNKQRQAQLCYDIACVHIDQGNLRDAGRLLQQSISLFRQTEDHRGIDQVGRTMMGLSILVHRRVTAHQMTFRDVERGSKSNKAKS